MNGEVKVVLKEAPISFVTMASDAGSNVPRGRRVVVTGPPAIMDLIGAADVALLSALVDSLHEPAMAWPAEVLLAALTGRDADVVDAFARRPHDWLVTLRESAEQAWRAWLAAHRASLVWNPTQQQFTWRDR